MSKDQFEHWIDRAAKVFSTGTFVIVSILGWNAMDWHKEMEKADSRIAQLELKSAASDANRFTSNDAARMQQSILDLIAATQRDTSNVATALQSISDNLRRIDQRAAQNAEMLQNLREQLARRGNQ